MTNSEDDTQSTIEREEHLDAETILDDAEELFEKKSEGPPEIVPDAPPSPHDPHLA